jgi:hypothetical protein
LLVLDEVETLQRVRGDVREKGLNALRQLVDEVDAGMFPGLYLVITGTPAFYDGPQGIRRLEPLAQRLHVDFQTDARFDSPRAVQVRLPGFTHDRLVEVGRTIRDLYARDAQARDRVLALADDAYVAELAGAVAVHQCRCPDVTGMCARTGTLSDGGPSHFQAAISGDDPRRAGSSPSSSSRSSPACRLQDFPVPMDLAPERFTVATSLRDHSTPG